MPSCVVLDEAFDLSRQILCPNDRKCHTLKIICNYMHTRACRIVECTFGMFCNKWQICHRAIDISIEFIDDLVKYCCILYIFIRKHDGIQFAKTVYECSLESISPFCESRILSAVNIRTYFATYFMSEHRSVPL